VGIYPAPSLVQISGSVETQPGATRRAPPPHPREGILPGLGLMGCWMPRGRRKPQGDDITCGEIGFAGPPVPGGFYRDSREESGDGADGIHWLRIPLGVVVGEAAGVSAETGRGDFSETTGGKPYSLTPQTASIGVGRMGTMPHRAPRRRPHAEVANFDTLNGGIDHAR